MNNIENTTITVGDLYAGVTDGRIISDIALQREIVYGTEKQELVIDSLLTGIPLPAFYFWRNEEGVLEVLDGKQRIEAIKKFRENDLEYKGRLWRQLPAIQTAFNAVELSAIICTGDDSLKREIFRRINTLGVPLSPFEVLNGLFHGVYIEELTAYAGLPTTAGVFGANARGSVQMRVLKWLLTLDGVKPSFTNISEYVEAHQNTSFIVDQNRLRPYVKFISGVFTFDVVPFNDIYYHLALKYVKDEGIWKAHRDAINAAVRAFRRSEDYRYIQDKAQEIEDRIKAVVGNVSVDPKRLFTRDDKERLLEQVKCEDGLYPCAECGNHFRAEELTIDHKKPWSLGGRTELSNAQLLCRPCNSRKRDKE